MGTGEFNAGGNPVMDWHPIQGGVEVLLVASCYGNQDKLQPDGPLGSYTDLTYNHAAFTYYFFKGYISSMKRKHFPCVSPPGIKMQSPLFIVTLE